MTKIVVKPRDEIAYLDDEFNPVSKEAHTMVKITKPDGSVIFGIRQPVVEKGGAGSGNFGHTGIPGHQGGSKSGKDYGLSGGNTFKDIQRVVKQEVKAQFGKEAILGSTIFTGSVHGGLHLEFIRDDKVKDLVTDIMNTTGRKKWSIYKGWDAKSDKDSYILKVDYEISLV